MTINQVRQVYLKNMKSHGHVIIPSSSLVPENDPTTLFTGSGMQPLISYFLGEAHPQGKRITNAQKCLRAEDIDEVGDNRHTTFFEMLGNWSFGDYWKKDQLNWLWQFLVNDIGLNPDNLYVTVFSGNKEYSIPPDHESVQIWQELFKSQGISAKAVHLGSEQNGAIKGMQNGRIFYYDAAKNWWSRAGVPANMQVGEPGGPDSEIFYEFKSIAHDQSFGKQCHPNCDCGRFLEIGNSVFMTYLKDEDGSFTELPQKNIDFGGGLERIAAASQDNPDVFATDIFAAMIDTLEAESGKVYENHQSTMRIVVDHIRAAVHMIADNVLPSNKTQGYMARRLIRKSLVEIEKLEISNQVISLLVDTTINNYKSAYPQINKKRSFITQTILNEARKFDKTLKKGLSQFKSLLADQQTLTGEHAFKLFETYGFPLELSIDAAKDCKLKIDKDIAQQFTNAKENHAQKSRQLSQGSFKGGLADSSLRTTQYHTATHLLHQALRDLLGNDAQQLGSNITSERLRFDVKHAQKLTQKQINEIESTINQKIESGLPVHKTIEEKDNALKSGALAFFSQKYANTVSVYTIGTNPHKDWYSKELCGGPHVKNTSEIPPLKITKQKSIGSNTLRLYLQVK